MRSGLDELFGPNDAQLMVIAEAPLLDVHVRYDGRVIAPRLGWVRGSHIGYALFPAMRARKYEPVLEVTWRTMTEEHSLSKPMEQVDSGGRCLYVLRLDRKGDPVLPERHDSFSPFWWTCHFY